LRRTVLSLILALVASSCLHSSRIMTQNATSKEKPVIKQNISIKNLSMFHAPIPAGVTKQDMIQWGRVSICEMGGNWTYHGPVYSGGLGITNRNWIAYGGLKYAPNAGLATPEQQVAVAKRINTGYTVPDQHGCGKGW